jgi:2-polyprenyl-6-methoxyphenol hydroxylase-like FAD-dependent oxidoreductase
MAHRSDILIVGAGPTGLMLASLLSRWGITPRIIDVNTGPSQYSKATGVQSRTLEAFEQLGFANSAVEQGLPAYSVNLHNDAGKIGRLTFGDAGKGVSPFPYILILPQDRTEAILGDDLRAHGVQVEWNTRLETFIQTKDGIQVTLNKNGQTETAYYRYLLGADGARSIVRKTLGVDFQGETYDHLFFVADLRIEGAPVEGELNIFLSNRFKFVAMFPMKGTRRFRLVGIVPEAYRHLESPTFEELQPYFKQNMGRLMQFSDVAWFATYRVHHRVASQFKVGNTFLLGDASHVHSPVGGQGMNTGLMDAYNLAWKLALVLRGEADERLLETYHEERYPNAVALVNTTDRIFSSFIAATNGWAGFVRRWVVPLVVPSVLRLKQAQRRAYDILSQTALTYQGRSLSVDQLGGAVKAGDRFPWFSFDKQDTYQQLSVIRFTLFAVGDWSSQQNEIEVLRSDLLQPVFVLNREVYARTGLADGLYVVRPDGYIGLRTNNLEAVQSYLHTTVGINPFSINRAST